MSDPPARADKAQDRADELLASADRCRRLATWLNDRVTIDRLLEMARKCEARAAALGRRP